MSAPTDTNVGGIAGLDGNALAGNRNDPATPLANQPCADPRNGKIKYVRLWISDLLADTYRLTPAAMGAYIRLYAATVAAQSPLSDDPAAISNITGTSRRAWSAIRAELLAAGVIKIRNGYLIDSRAEKAINEFQAASTRNRMNVGNRYAVIDGLRDAKP